MAREGLTMRIFRRFGARTAILLSCLVALGSVAARAETVTLATEGAYPPFNKTVADCGFSGFEIELGHAICLKAKLDCKWVKHDFSGMIPALLAGKYDMVVSAMSINADREKVALFSIPYLNDGFRFYGPKGAPDAEATALAGKKVGVLTGSTGERFVGTHWPKAETRGYGDIDQINADLDAGRIDYGFNAQLPVSTFLKGPAGANYAAIGALYTDPVLGRGMGGMFRPDGKALKARFDEAIRAVHADGTFDKLSAKYFGSGVNVRADKLW